MKRSLALLLSLLALVGCQGDAPTRSDGGRVSGYIPSGGPYVPNSGLGNSSSALAGTGLAASGSTIAIDPTYTQRRVSGVCSSPNGVITVAQDGTVTCATGTGDITSVVAGTGLSGGATSGDATLNVSLPTTSCSTGQAETATAGTGTATCTTLISGTTNQGTKFTGANTIGVSNFDDDGTTLSIPHGGSAIQCTEATGVCTWTGGQTFNGNVGLGVTPAVQFDQVEVNIGDHQITRYGSQSAVTLRRANGTSGSPTGLVNGSLLGILRVSGYTNAGAFSGGYSMVTAAPDETWTSTANGFATRIGAVRDGTLTNLDVITAVGGTAASGSLVGIGTTAPTHRLSIGLPGTGQIPVVTACGSAPAPALSAGAADLKGGVTVGGGTVTSCTLTFGTAFSTYENCMVTSATGTIAVSYTQSLTAIVVTSVASMNGDHLDWDCMGSL